MYMLNSLMMTTMIWSQMMLQNVMVLASVGMGILLVWEMWQRFDWFKTLVKAIGIYGVPTLIGCVVLLFLSLPFFPGLGALLPLIVFMYGSPVVVLIAVIVGCVKYHRNASKIQRDATQDMIFSSVVIGNNTSTGDYYDAF